MRYLAFLFVLLSAQLAQAQTIVVTSWSEPGACGGDGVWGGLVNVYWPAQDLPMAIRLSRFCDGGYGAYLEGVGGDPNVFTRPGFDPIRADVLALIAAPCSNCPEECDPVNESLIGLNCCPSPQFGATYYVAVDENDCPYLACNTANCMTCPPPPATPEGTSCPCGAGETGDGTITYVYENGCPVGTVCDGCEPCPELMNVGEPCEYRDVDGELIQGTYGTETGPDNCPRLVCRADTSGQGCEEDYNEDGVPDVLEGNPYRDMDHGAACECEDGEQGTVKWANNGFGCLVPSCECKCEDKDGDDCCDDEDPDPDDSSVTCEDCEFEIGEKVTAIQNVFLSKIPSPSTTNTVAYNFEFDLGATPIYVFGKPVAFGQRFGGNLSSGEMWLGQQQENPGRVGVNHEVFEWFIARRGEFRSLLSLVAYAFGLRAILLAIFDPSR